MNVVDSSGWLEYFASGKNIPFFATAIQETDSLFVPTIYLYEIFKGMLSQRGEEKALQAVGIKSLGTITELTQEIAIYAARISSELKLAMADSVILAIARAHEATLWTQDADFAGIEGVQYIEKAGG